MIRISIEPQFDADVVIVGAGPAGASAVAYIAHAGLKVILIDRQIFPRDKVCGDFVGPTALSELEKLGITDLPEYKKTNIIRHAALYLDGQELISSSIPDVEGLPPYGRVIPRIKLDKWIFDTAREAGVYTLEKFCFTRFERTPDGITLTVEGPDEIRNLQTRLLIGADGSNSTVSRLLWGQSSPGGDRTIAVRAYFEGIDGPVDQADLYFTSKSFPGYCWLFPTSRDSANVGVGMLLETLPRTSDHLRELLLRLIKEDAILSCRLHQATMVGKIGGWPLTTYNPRRPIVGDRIILIGDAAGLINPLNGEGIQSALLSRRWASEVAVSCATQNDFSSTALSIYSTRVKKALRYDMALPNLILQFIRNRSFNPIWLHALQIITTRARSDLNYAHITGGILAGLVPATDAVSLKIIGNTLEEAAISMGLGSINHVLRGPGHLAEVGLHTAPEGAKIACDIIQHPTDFLKWGLGLASSATEVVDQVSRNLIEPKMRP